MLQDKTDNFKQTQNLFIYLAKLKYDYKKDIFKKYSHLDNFLDQLGICLLQFF